MANLNKVFLMGNLTADPRAALHPQRHRRHGHPPRHQPLLCGRQQRTPGGNHLCGRHPLEPPGGSSRQLPQQGPRSLCGRTPATGLLEDKASGQKRTKLRVIGENSSFSPAAVKATWAALRASSPGSSPLQQLRAVPSGPELQSAPHASLQPAVPATLETWMTKSRSKARTNNFFSQAAFPPCQAVFFMAGIPAEAKHRPGARRRSTAVP